MQTITVVQLRDSMRQAGPPTNALAALVRGRWNDRETCAREYGPRVWVG
jgi:hypothetical protein